MKVFTRFHSNRLNFTTIFFGVLIFLFCFYSGFGQATFTAGSSDAALLTQLQGPGVTLSNATLENGDRPSQVGVFSSGISGANLSVDTGVVLSTGSVAQAFGANGSAPFPSNSGVAATIDAPGAPTYSDPDITAIDPSATRDVVVFSFDVTLDPGNTVLQVAYQFGSEEYPDYVGSQFNDIFGFFVSGGGLPGTQNIAIVPGTSLPVAVNTVNAGFLGCADDATPEDLTNSAQYINNGHSTSSPPCNTNPGPFVMFTEYNGVTNRFVGTLNGLVPGNTYRFKMAIADTGDASLDSAVFVNQISAAATAAVCGGTTIPAGTLAPATGFVADTYVVNPDLSIISNTPGRGYTDAGIGYRMGTPTATTDSDYVLQFSTRLPK
ncbi:MAG: choice-of-anchor L domain-containing protein [Flavobacteriaceae bacterium]